MKLLKTLLKKVKKTLILAWEIFKDFPEPN